MKAAKCSKKFLKDNLPKTNVGLQFISKKAICFSLMLLFFDKYSLCLVMVSTLQVSWSCLRSRCFVVLVITWAQLERYDCSAR